MDSGDRGTAPGRRRVTPEIIVETGIVLTLNRLTVKALAEQLGVSIVAIYNNIDTLDTLKTVVAEEILARWTLPTPQPGDTIEQSLTILADALKDLVHADPGIAGYLARIDASSPALSRMNAVQKTYAQLYDLTPKQTGWAVVTVVEHAIALAERIHVQEGRDRGSDRSALEDNPDLEFIAQTVDDTPRTEHDYWAWSMRAVIVGVLTLIADPHFREV
jgi:hypothetical protein